MDAVKLAIVAMQHRAELFRLWELLQPTFEEAKHVAPDVKDIVQELLPKFFPEIQESIAGSGPCAQFGVKWVQESLIKLGYELKADGVYGENTKKAVGMFKAEHMGPSKVDGWAGVATCVALYQKVNK